MRAFLRYFHARLRRENELAEYRYYMSDCAAGIIKAFGNVEVPRFYEITHPAPPDNRTPQEIISEITARAGLKVVRRINGDNKRISLDGDAGA